MVWFCENHIWCLKLIVSNWVFYIQIFRCFRVFCHLAYVQLRAIRTGTTNQCAQNWFTDVKYELCQPFSRVVMGSYEPIWELPWGVLTVSDIELQEMSPRNDPVSFMPLYDCIHTLYVFFFFRNLSYEIFWHRYADFGHSNLGVYILWCITCFDSRIIIWSHILVTVFCCNVNLDSFLTIDMYFLLPYEPQLSPLLWMAGWWQGVEIVWKFLQRMFVVITSKSCVVRVVVNIHKLIFAKMFEWVLNTLLGKNMFKMNIKDVETIFALIRSQTFIYWVTSFCV